MDQKLAKTSLNYLKKLTKNDLHLGKIINDFEIYKIEQYEIMERELTYLTNTEKLALGLFRSKIKSQNQYTKESHELKKHRYDLSTNEQYRNSDLQKKYQQKYNMEARKLNQKHLYAKSKLISGFYKRFFTKKESTLSATEKTVGFEADYFADYKLFLELFDQEMQLYFADGNKEVVKSIVDKYNAMHQSSEMVEEEFQQKLVELKNNMVNKYNDKINNMVVGRPKKVPKDTEAKLIERTEKRDIKNKKIISNYGTKSQEIKQKTTERISKREAKLELEKGRLVKKRDSYIELGQLDQQKYKLRIKTFQERNHLNQGVVLSVENLTMKFGGLVAVDNLSFEIKEKEIFGLIGPNGAGKTTVFNCITKFYTPNEGTMIFRKNSKSRIFNLNNKKTHEVIKTGIGRSFQNIELIWELTVLENLLVGAHSTYKTGLPGSIFRTKRRKFEDLIAKERAEKILVKFGINQYKERYPLGLPYGILKKIEFARTLMTKPGMIILDEPAAGLNESESQDLSDLILKIRDEFNCTILLVEHDMSLVMKVCDRICAISFGKKLAIGSPSEIQNDSLVKEAYLGGEM